MGDLYSSLGLQNPGRSKEAAYTFKLYEVICWANVHWADRVRGQAILFGQQDCYTRLSVNYVLQNG